MFESHWSKTGRVYIAEMTRARRREMAELPKGTRNAGAGTCERAQRKGETMDIVTMVEGQGGDSNAARVKWGGQ